MYFGFCSALAALTSYPRCCRNAKKRKRRKRQRTNECTHRTAAAIRRRNSRRHGQYVVVAICERFLALLCRERHERFSCCKSAAYSGKAAYRVAGKQEVLRTDEAKHCRADRTCAAGCDGIAKIQSAKETGKSNLLSPVSCCQTAAVFCCSTFSILPIRSFDAF